MNKTFLLIGLPLVMACGNPAPSAVRTHNDQPSFNWSDPDLIPGQILVDLKDNVSDSDVRDLENSTGLSFSENNSVAHEYRYEEATVSVADESSVLEKLNADSRVEHAEPMIRVHALWTPNDPLYTDQWGMTRVGAESSWNMSCGMGARVFVVDTGVSCTGDSPLNDLAKCGEGYDFVHNKPGGADDQQHGSHVAGTIAQLTNNGIGGAGVAPCANITPVKVLSASGSGTMEQVAEGIRWSADHGAQIINMSLGSSHPSNVIKDACQYAYDKGVTIIAAAGNDSGPVGYPAAYPSVIAVSAVDKNDSIADFSSRGKELAVAAPGVGILQQTICDKDPNGCFESFSGTSMASPFTAGVAALIVSSGITEPAAVKEKLQSTADAKDNKKQFGAGIIRADNAVRSTLLSHFIISVIALIGVLFVTRKVIHSQWKNKLSILGMIIGGFGFMPLAFTGILPRMGMFRVVGELVSRPFGNWDLVLGHGHSWLLLASCVPTAILSVIMIGHSKLRFFSGGFALGAAALCGQIAYSNDVRFAFGSVAMRVFMIASAFVCMYFAKATFAAKKA